MDRSLLSARNAAVTISRDRPSAGSVITGPPLARPWSGSAASGPSLLTRGTGWVAGRPGPQLTAGQGPQPYSQRNGRVPRTDPGPGGWAARPASRGRAGVGNRRTRPPGRPAGA